MKRTEFHRILTKVLSAGVETVTVSNRREDPRFPGEFIKDANGEDRWFQSVVLRLRSTLDASVLAERNLHVPKVAHSELAREHVDFVLDYIERNDIPITEPEPVDPLALELSQTKAQVAEMAAQIAAITRAIAPKAETAE